MFGCLARWLFPQASSLKSQACSRLFGFSPEGGEPEAPESGWERVDGRENQMRLILIDDCRVMMLLFWSGRRRHWCLDPFGDVWSDPLRAWRLGEKPSSGVPSPRRGCLGLTQRRKGRWRDEGLSPRIFQYSLNAIPDIRLAPLRPRSFGRGSKGRGG